MRFLHPIAAIPLGFCLLYAQEPDAWDFVPGERILLFDDYSDMPRGAAPPHWKVRGATMRLVEGRLAATDGQESILWPNITKWPKNFTIEMEVNIKPSAEDSAPPRTLDWSFLTSDDSWTMHAAFDLNTPNECSLLLEIAGGESQSQTCRIQTGLPNKIAIWSQGGRIRVYVNGERVVDINQVEFAFDKVSLRINGGSPLPVALGPVRIAESAPDFSQTLFSSGRYVSHGILFDVNSDQIKPESKPVLEQISDALLAQSALKLRIEGHTDSSGDPAKNLELSRRRAASVKSALVDLGVGADRLTNEGFGDTKPAAKNDTPQGRAENRRVEFVKI